MGDGSCDESVLEYFSRHLQAQEEILVRAYHFARLVADPLVTFQELRSLLQCESARSKELTAQLEHAHLEHEAAIEKLKVHSASESYKMLSSQVLDRISRPARRRG